MSAGLNVHGTAFRALQRTARSALSGEPRLGIGIAKELPHEGAEQGISSAMLSGGLLEPWHLPRCRSNPKASRRAGQRFVRTQCILHALERPGRGGFPVRLEGKDRRAPGEWRALARQGTGDCSALLVPA